MDTYAGLKELQEKVRAQSGAIDALIDTLDQIEDRIERFERAYPLPEMETTPGEEG